MSALVVKPLSTGNSTVDSSDCICIILPDDVIFRTAIYGQLAIMGRPEFWVQRGLVTEEESANYFAEKILTALLAISSC